jgi:hypothetical protein
VPVFPPGDNPVMLLAQGKCQDLATMTGTWAVKNVPAGDVSLFGAAAQVCLQNWNAAKTALHKLPSPLASADCVKSSVLGWVTSTLATHDADPTTTFVFVPAGPQFGTCGVSLPPTGLIDVVGAGPNAAHPYEELAAHQCDQLKAATESWQPPISSPAGVSPAIFRLYHGAAEACLLQWSGASADLQMLQSGSLGGTKSLTCPEMVVRSWLQDMVAAHNATPQVQPTVTTNSAVNPSPCPVPSPSS